MKKTNRLTALILSLMMVLTYMPAMAFADDEAAAEPVSVEAAAEAAAGDAVTEEAAAVEEPAEAVQPADTVSAETADAEAAEAVIEEDEDLPEDEDAVYDDADESDVGYAEASFSEGIDAEGLAGADPEQQVENFLFSDESEPAENKQTPQRVMSVKGSRLTGNNLKYYNNLKTIIDQVAAGSRVSTYKTVKVGSWLGKRTFTASQLGVSKIGYKSGGKWYVTSAAKKKINALYNPGSWRAVYTSLLSDLSNKSFWVDWYADQSFYSWNCNYSFNRNSITFTSGSAITFNVPVMPEFGVDASSSTVYVFKADKSKIAAASTAKESAKYIVNQFVNDVDISGYTDAQIDLLRMMYYCDWIAALTTYDTEAAKTNVNRTSPWSWISVLDNNTNTMAVCAGYARAFKYLCDLSKFRSNWIDCQIATGLAYADDPNSSHMWNIVRMDDGLNYLVDPTWMDDDSDSVDTDWFLRGDPYGNSKTFTINGNTREYDSWFISTFPAAERKLSTKSYYQMGSTRTISLKRPTIKTPASGKKKITVKWKAVTSALGALYVDGYQVRYSTRSSMKGSKTVTVKGYKKGSKTISKLRSGRAYYVQVRSYAKLGGKTYYSKWSSRKKVRAK